MFQIKSIIKIIKMIFPREEMITESELSEIVKSYNTQISKKLLFI